MGTAREAPVVYVDPAPSRGDHLPGLLGLGATAPVVRVRFAGTRVWVVCEPRLVRSILLDPRFSKAIEHAPPELADPLITATRDAGIGNLLLSEGTEHIRLRRLHMTVFNPRAIRAREPAIAGLTRQLLAAIGDAEVDLVEALAYPLPVAVISELLGLPEDVRPVLRAASEDISFGGSPEIVGRGVARLYATVGHLVHAEPDRLLPGMITELLALGDELSSREVVMWMAGLFIPGHESTASLLASALYHVLRLPPAERPRGREELTAFTEETLRRDPPFPLSTYRFTTEEVVLDGVRVPAGAPVLVNLAAANHDPDAFPSPAEFAPGRAGAHFSFGFGPHLCLGATLARLEAVVALDSFLGAYPRARLADPDAPPEWQGDLAIRRLPRLRARLVG
ncbi:cytochrome P450 [Amycolatopsis anabasis]|uniref:cytochrome P450 n=1 Tax=Amycolatopsis anabasis TaxID=1840409 RepID=UPI00131D16DD|nr:cytochrome P450 [Amycolatopsis anabasis]